MAKTEKDSFAATMKNYGKFHAVTTLPISQKDKKKLHVATLQLQFCINQKKDNQSKTKQINLFDL